MPSHLADITTLTPFVDFFQSQGGKADSILERKTIPISALRSGSGKITKIQLYSTVDILAKSAGFDDFGFRVGQDFTAQNMGKLGEAMLQASTLIDALRTLQYYVHHWVEGSTILFREDTEHLWLIDRASDGLAEFRNQTNQTTIFLLTNLVRLVAGDQWSPSLAAIGNKAPQPSSLPIDFSHTAFTQQKLDNAIAIPKELLSKPLPKTPSSNVPLSEERPSFYNKLQILVTTHLLSGYLLGIRELAEISNISTRSLLRKLSEHGVSYRHLLDRVRYEIACSMLKQEIPVKEVAHMLHYSGANNFTRAFKRISGLTPSQWKTRNP